MNNHRSYERTLSLYAPLLGVLLFISLASASAQVPIDRSLDSIRLAFKDPCGGPELTGHYEIAPYIRALPPNAPDKYRDFRGLLIEENLVKELYPLLTSLFFDAGSAVIPERYIRFTDPWQTERFSDSTIPGGTLAKYYQMLNIIGYRMQKYPETKIQIVGSNSNESGIGEVRDLSKKRGEIVYDYLMNIWKIEPNRMQLLPAHDLPEQVSAIKDSLGIAENRRTEIRSSDWEILKPIVNVSFRRTPQPESATFTMRNGIDDSLILRRAIEIRRKGRLWHTMTDIGISTLKSPLFNWGANGDEDSIPVDEQPYRAQLVLYLRDGRECSSPEITIPVAIVTNEEKRRERLIDSTKDIYSLVLFGFNSFRPSPLNERITREYVVNDIRRGARIQVIGHSSSPEEERRLHLSTKRADAIVQIIRQRVRSGLYFSLNGTGVGVEDPLYPNELPEGRFYNRTVQVRIASPTGEDMER